MSNCKGCVVMIWAEWLIDTKTEFGSSSGAQPPREFKVCVKKALAVEHYNGEAWPRK